MPPSTGRYNNLISAVVEAMNSLTREYARMSEVPDFGGGAQILAELQAFGQTWGDDWGVCGRG